MTQETFEQLLAFLSPDREQAGRKYELIRSKLIKYFEWRGITTPDAQADETINRVARKISEGTPIHPLEGYCYGVARLVLLETLREQERARAAIQALPPADGSAVSVEEDDDDSELQRDCARKCLHGLPVQSRELIMAYHQAERGSYIEQRKQLAGKLGIPLNALRIRAYRVRSALEKCLAECVERHSR